MNRASAGTALASAPALAPDLESLGVFKPNRSAPLHRWVSFTEGFSAQLVLRCLDASAESPLIYDPFSGTGTTPLVAAQLGHTARWSEINPYLREATETKIVAATSDKRTRARCISAISEALLSGPAWDTLDTTHPLLTANDKRGFFDSEVASELVAWLGRFESLSNKLARRLGRLAVATAAVPTSNMKRSVDLRRRTPSELAKTRPRVADAVRERVGAFCDDLRSLPRAPGEATLACHDARVPPSSLRDVDLVVTSPPYLNGTNYFRNTKLELLLLSLIKSEDDLRIFRSQAITAGINNVSKRIADPIPIAFVEPVAEQLDAVAYDARIPKMVRAYFADMRGVLDATRRVMRPGGRFILDIGDSRFAGVHVDTPTILANIAESVGWSLTNVEIIRSRVAKDGNPLCQKLLSLESN